LGAKSGGHGLELGGSVAQISVVKDMMAKKSRGPTPPRRCLIFRLDRGPTRHARSILSGVQRLSCRPLPPLMLKCIIYDAETPPKVPEGVDLPTP